MDGTNSHILYYYAVTSVVCCRIFVLRFIPLMEMSRAARTVNVWLNYYVWMINYCISKHLNWAGICLHNVHYTFVSLSCRLSLYCTYILIQYCHFCFPLVNSAIYYYFSTVVITLFPFFFVCFLFIFPSCNSFCCCCFILSPCGEWTAAPALFFCAGNNNWEKEKGKTFGGLFIRRSREPNTHTQQSERNNQNRNAVIFSTSLF